MPINIKVAGAWKSATPKVKVSGTWRNVAQAYVKVSGTWKELIETIVPWVGVLSNASYIRLKSFGNINDFCFSADGTILYVVDGIADEIEQYNLGSPFSISSTTLAGTFSTSADGDTPFDIAMNKDGTKWHVLEFGTGKILEYTMSTPWDITTSSLSNSKSFGVTSICWVDNGKGLLYTSYSNGYYARVRLARYAVPYDPFSTYLGYTGFDSEDIGGDRFPEGAYISNDGVYVYVAGSITDAVQEYTLSTPWDLSTATLTHTETIAGADVLESVYFNIDGSKMFVGDVFNDNIREYNT